MKKKIITIAIVGTFLLLSIPTVVSNETETEQYRWNLISIKGKCEGFSCGTILHFFSLWATHQPMSLFDVTEDTEIRINGELYPLDEISDVRMKGFIGTSFFPFQWILYEKQEIDPPHEIMVFGVCKQVEIV